MQSVTNLKIRQNSIKSGGKAKRFENILAYLTYLIIVSTPIKFPVWDLLLEVLPVQFLILGGIPALDKK